MFVYLQTVCILTFKVNDEECAWSTVAGTNYLFVRDTYTVSHIVTEFIQRSLLLFLVSLTSLSVAQV